MHFFRRYVCLVCYVWCTNKLTARLIARDGRWVNLWSNDYNPPLSPASHWSFPSPVSSPFDRCDFICTRDLARRFSPLQPSPAAWNNNKNLRKQNLTKSFPSRLHSRFFTCCSFFFIVILMLLRIVYPVRYWDGNQSMHVKRKSQENCYDNEKTRGLPSTQK